MRVSVTVTKPSRGSLIRLSSISATICWMRSASLRARAASTMIALPFYGHVKTERSSGPGAIVGPPRRSVLVIEKPPPRGQQLDLGPRGHQPLALVEHPGAVGRRARHDRHPDLRPAVQ